MKLIFTSLLVFLLLFGAVFSASAAIKIDGKDHDFEWDYAECVEIISSSESNNVGFSLIKCCFDSNGYDAYFMLFLTDRLSENLDDCGFILTLNNGVEILVTADNVITDYDFDLFNISAQMNFESYDGVYCEIKVSYKKGLPDTVGGTVSFIDGTGNNSYYYPFSFDYNNTHGTAVSEKETAKLTEKTTKENTTKIKTTRAETTKKPVTVKPETTSSKRNENKTVVYFYEKEVVVSQVYVSDASPNTLNEPFEESTTAPALTEQTQRYFQISDGVEIQKIVCVIGGLILIAFAAWAGLSAKKKPEENPSDSSNESDK